jgi:hypothetical protein
MSYEKKISRQNPGLIVCLLDDSGSMTGNLPGTSDTKFKWVERYMGIILALLLERSSEVRGNDVVIKPRYYVHVIKYGSGTEIWGHPHMDIEAAVQHFTNAGNSLGLGGTMGGTDAKAAFEQAYQFLKQEISSERYRDSFPPMVFHLTDGMSGTDAAPVAEQIKQLTTNDGNVLIVNAYIGTQTSLNYQGPEDFPGYLDIAEAGPGPDNIRLFHMSSQAPQCIQDDLKTDSIFPQLRSGARLFFDVRTKEMLKNVIQVIGSMGSRMVR